MGFDVDAASVLNDNLLCNGQAHARLTGTMYPFRVERLEHAELLAARNAGPGITHGQLDALVIRAGADCQFPALATGFTDGIDGVIKQLLEQRAQGVMLPG